MAIFRPNKPAVVITTPAIHRLLMQAPKLQEGKTPSGHKIGR